MNKKRTASILFAFIALHSAKSNETVEGILVIDQADYPGTYLYSGDTPLAALRVNVAQHFLDVGDLYSAAPALGVRFFANDIERMRISSDGNTGIGTKTPSSLLELYKISSSGSSISPLLELTNSIEEPETGDGQSIEFHNLWASSTPRAGIEMRYIGSYTDSSLVFRTRSGSDYNESMTIDNYGDVGIGTSSPGGYKLAVNGTVRAKEMIVDTGWSDFVFEKGYNLKSLNEVEHHIQEHGHLPGVPSASIVESEGLSVGNAHKIMMQKIEELTLYVIAQGKKIEAQQIRIAELESKMGLQ